MAEVLIRNGANLIVGLPIQKEIIIYDDDSLAEVGAGDTPF